MYNLKSVVTTISTQHPDEVVQAHHLSQQDFAYIMEGLTGPFYQRMKEERGNWEGRLQRQPTLCTGAQVYNSIPYHTVMNHTLLYHYTTILYCTVLYCSTVL